MKKLIADYAAQGEALQQLVANGARGALFWRPDSSRWSVAEVCGHLADAESLAADRIRRILTQDRAEFRGYDQNAWVSKLGYQTGQIEPVVERFAVLRGANAALLVSLDDAAWHLAGSHESYGVMTLYAWIVDYIAHTAGHLKQMRALLAAYQHEGQKGQERTNMAKSQDKENDEQNDKGNKEAKGKERKKERGVLVGRVRKAVKKSRRKLSEEKFEKELKRTIAFLEGMQARLGEKNGDGSLQEPVILPGVLVDAAQVETPRSEEAPAPISNPAAY